MPDRFRILKLNSDTHNGKCLKVSGLGETFTFSLILFDLGGFQSLMPYEVFSYEGRRGVSRSLRAMRHRGHQYNGMFLVQFLKPKKPSTPRDLVRWTSGQDPGASRYAGPFPGIKTKMWHKMMSF